MIVIWNVIFICKIRSILTFFCFVLETELPDQVLCCSGWSVRAIQGRCCWCTCFLSTSHTQNLKMSKIRDVDHLLSCIYFFFQRGLSDNNHSLFLNISLLERKTKGKLLASIFLINGLLLCTQQIVSCMIASCLLQ